MGLLSHGTPLDWPSSVAYHHYIKHHGIIQFLHIFHRYKNRQNDVFLWGDEIEHCLLRFDHQQRKVRLALRAPELLEQLEALPRTSVNSAPPTPSSTGHTTTTGPLPSRRNANFVPEYGAFMIEATPARPYGGYTADLRIVEPNMKLRREVIQQLLQAHECLITLTNFPLLGEGDFIATSQVERKGPVLESTYVPDCILARHPRFATLSQNIRMRRQSKVCIRVPLFIDEKTIETQQQLIEERKQLSVEQKYSKLPVKSQRFPHAYIPPEPDCKCQPAIDELHEIHMDAMAFGMGCCCLQVTFQTRSLKEARQLYDQLAVFSPIMLAMTAASPFFRGRISDQDVRWNVISQSVDDRTPFERGVEATTNKACNHVEGAVESEIRTASSSVSPTHPSTNPRNIEALSPSAAHASAPQRLSKSRYDSISTYICNSSPYFKSAYNDVPCEVDEHALQQLRGDGEVDELLARHISHLFVRDPLVLYDEAIVLNDEQSTEHFENLQSTNWQSVRFKPPPVNSSIGWRVEFRTMEVQLTDFENAAYTVFVALTSRAILYFDLNLYLPLSKVDDNMKRAHQRDAVKVQKFWWRKQVKTCLSDTRSDSIEDEYELQSIEEILCGKSDNQPGLIQLVRLYLDCIKADGDTKCQVSKYLQLIEQRARGQLMTCATWLRSFVKQHPLYKHDSILSEELVYELMNTCQAIQLGNVEVTQLLGKLCNCPEAQVAVDGNGIVGVEDSDSETLAAKRGSELIGSPRRISIDGHNNKIDLRDADACKRFRQFIQEYTQKQQQQTCKTCHSGNNATDVSAASASVPSQPLSLPPSVVQLQS